MPKIIGKTWFETLLGVDGISKSDVLGYYHEQAVKGKSDNGIYYAKHNIYTPGDRRSLREDENLYFLDRAIQNARIVSVDTTFVRWFALVLGFPKTEGDRWLKERVTDSSWTPRELLEDNEGNVVLDASVYLDNAIFDAKWDYI